MIWQIVEHLASGAQTAWILTYCVRNVLQTLRRDVPRLVDRVFFEGRPVVPFLLVGAYLAGAIVNGTEDMGWRIFSLALGFTLWWMARNEKDDDDRWKRRAKAAADRIVRTGAKLAVVPAGGRS
jgi:hypothetical protein